MKKIGLYAGTFDPVHEGHIALIEQSIEELDLDVVYCLPDQVPPHKPLATDYIHRKAMLEIATKHLEKVELAQTESDYAKFPETINELGVDDSDTYIVMGSDAAINLRNWRGSDRIIREMKFIVGVRTSDDEQRVENEFSKLGVTKSRYTLIAIPCQDYSSTRVRQGLQSPYLSIADYIRKHSLYKV